VVRRALLCLALWPWLLLLGLADAAAAEPVRLRLSFQLPLTSTLGANLVQLKEAAARDPDSAVAIEILHGAKALPDRTVAKSVMAGEVEMATANVVTLADRVKGVDILSLPFLFNSHTLLKAMLDPSRRSRRLLDEAILKTGARVLMWQPYGINVFFSKGAPASKPADIAGRKIRASGAIDVEFGRACGAKPELIAAGAQHEAMKTGRVEMAMTSAENVSARKFWDVSDTLTRTNHSPVMLLLLVNEQAWQSLGPAQREAIGSAAADAERELWEGLVRADEEADAFARAKGMKVAELSSFDLAEWRDGIQAVLGACAAMPGSCLPMAADGRYAVRSRLSVSDPLPTACRLAIAQTKKSARGHRRPRPPLHQAMDKRYPHACDFPSSRCSGSIFMLLARVPLNNVCSP
jgi:C4-dicarboxylate-binding protein DctP